METLNNHGKLKEMKEVKHLEHISGVNASDIVDVIEEGLELSNIEKIGKQSQSHIDYNEIQFNQLRIFIQPIFSLKDDTMTGAEALIRSYDKKITADKIIENMISTDRMKELDLRILETVCINKLWEKLGVERININISDNSLEKEGMANDIVNILGKYDAINHITLEINENTVFNSFTVISNLERLADSGIELSLDDFNVSLGWISAVSKFRLRELKYRYTLKSRIDRIRTVAKLAKALNVRLIIENVPDTRILNEIRLLNIDRVQSYITGIPEYATDLVS